jgi:Protein of unknown function (DUF1549)/Protein of unknown function (DUF1553)
MIRPHGAFRSALLVLLPCIAAENLHAQTPLLREVIDSRIQKAWKQKKITSAKPATDGEFLRRIYLDLAGSVPTYEETTAFLTSKDPAKRDKLIDRLMADPRFAIHQADVWDMILFGRNPPGFDTRNREGFQGWLRSRFEKNVPYDVWARELLKADGNSVENGALYYVQYRSAPEDAIVAISQTFLGVQLQCARCHDHPYEKWKQLDFYGMAAFLARLEVVGVGKKGSQTIYAIGEHDAGDIRFTGPAKDAAPGKKGEPVKPKFLDGTALEEPAPPPSKGERPTRFAPNKMPAKPKRSRKDRLAEWIASADNPYFARAVANRLWAQYMGRGLVQPVDNMSQSNTASIPDLLDVLGREMIAHKFDLKWFIKELVSSKTYQLSSVGSGEPMPDWHQHARSRPLSAEELAEAWRITTGYAAVEQASGKKAGMSRLRPLDGYLMSFFGSPNNGTGDFQGGLQEHLYLNNGPLSQMIAAGKGSLAEFVGDSKKRAEDRVERLFVQTLHRKPTPAEAEKFTDFLDKKGSAADAVWALITSSEFRFNH